MHIVLTWLVRVTLARLEWYASHFLISRHFSKVMLYFLHEENQNEISLNTNTLENTAARCHKFQKMAFQTFFKLPNLLIIQKHSGPENLKKSSPKKKKFFFGQIPLICNFKNGQKSIFELGKYSKLPKMKFH